MSKNECFAINSDVELLLDYKNVYHLHLEIYEETQFLESICLLCKKSMHSHFYYNLTKLFQHFRYLQTLTLNCVYGDMLIELPNIVEKFIHLR